MAATYHHARRLYIGTTAERAAVVLDVDGIGTDYWDTDVGVLYIWDGTAWVAGFAALPHDILSATHDDTTPAVVGRGDLMTGQGVAPLWQRLAHPGALYHLQTDATDVIWSQDIIMADDSHIGGTGLLDGRIIFDYTPAPDEIHVADATLVMDTSHILPAGAGQDLGSGIARWDVFAAFVDLPGTGWIGISAAAERLIFNVAGDATFAGVTSVVVPDDCWVGADAACSWVFDSSNGYVTTLDKVGMGIAIPLDEVHIVGITRFEHATPLNVFRESDQGLPAGMWRLGFDSDAFLIDQNTAGAGDFSTYVRRLVLLASGNFGLDVINPLARIHTREVTVLGGVAGNSQLISITSGHGGANEFKQSQWLYRDANGADWTTTRLHDAISIAGAFVTPGTDTKVWWERDPSNNIQSWGNAAATYMTLNAGRLGLGTVAAAASAILELSSTTGALLLTRMTTVQRNALGAVNGMVIYNTTTATVEAYEAGAWVNL